MKKLIIWFVKTMAALHERISDLNNGHEMNFNDKQLHFLVFAGFTMLLFWTVQLVFKALAKKKVTAISWIYTITVDVGLMFAIEVGQGLTRTGEMDLADVTSGLWGMVAAMAVYALFKLIGMILRILKTDSPTDGRDNMYKKYLS